MGSIVMPFVEEAIDLLPERGVDWGLGLRSRAGHEKA
jgi:hypothetical protein